MLVVCWIRQLRPQAAIRLFDHVAWANHRLAGQRLHVTAGISGYLTGISDITCNSRETVSPSVVIAISIAVSAGRRSPL